MYEVKGSLCFVLKFALPPFSPRLPSEVQISKQNRHKTFDKFLDPSKCHLNVQLQFHWTGIRQEKDRASFSGQELDN